MVFLKIFEKVDLKKKKADDMKFTHVMYGQAVALWGKFAQFWLVFYRPIYFTCTYGLQRKKT